MSASQNANSFFRVAGLSYNKYSAIANNALRRILKPEALKKRKADVVMRERAFTGGKATEKSDITDIHTPSAFAAAVESKSA